MPFRLGTNRIGRLVVGASTSFDADAQAYIDAIDTAGGSLSSAEETAIDTFFVDLKSSGVYSKLYALYPFLGGVADSNKINAINPGNNDLAFNGTWTHNVTGSYCAKSDANYADTELNISTDITDAATSISFGGVIIGGDTQGYQGLGDTGTNYTLIGGFNSNTEAHSGAVASSVGGTGFTGGGAMIVVNRVASTSFTGYYLGSGSADTAWDGSQSISATYTVPNYTFYVNAINGINGFNAGGRNIFSYISDGLTTGELDSIREIQNDLQTAFSRNIFS